MRSVIVLGATGSVGESAFDLLMRAGGPETYRTVALTGGANVARLAEMARALKARIAVTAWPEKLADLRAALAGTGIEAAAGTQAISEAADMPADRIAERCAGKPQRKAHEGAGLSAQNSICYGGELPGPLQDPVHRQADQTCQCTDIAPQSRAFFQSASARAGRTANAVNPAA